MVSDLNPLRWLAFLIGLSFLSPLHGQNLVVGMSAAFKGPSRGLSIELYRGSTAYFQHVNDKGGVHGRPIVIKAYDDGYDPTPAIENTIRLIEEDRAFLLFDYMGSPTVTRVLPLLKRYNDNRRPIYLFFPFTGAEPHRRFPYNESVFNLRASYHQETIELVDRFVDIGRKRIAVLYQVDAYGRSGWNDARLALSEYDESGNPLGENDADQPRLRMVAEASYHRGTAFSESFSEQLEILRGAEPDAVISVAT